MHKIKNKPWITPVIEIIKISELEKYIKFSACSTYVVSVTSFNIITKLLP